MSQTLTPTEAVSAQSVETPSVEPGTLLGPAVAYATQGAADTPRPAQAKLSEWIAAVADERTEPNHLVAQAPTGSGKGLAYLVPALTAAATRGERTLISTEGLGLQRQLIDKDAPAAAAAVAEATGYQVKTSVLKGFSNYVCEAKARTSAKTLLATSGSSDSLAADLAEDQRPAGEQVTVAGVTTDFATARDLLIWALSTDETPADRDCCPVLLARGEWQMVSISAQQCRGSKCPLFEECSPQTARAEAAESDIVVTNHTMLAIQATTTFPVVIGNKTLGEFSTIVVDEAHSLPKVVRSHGSAEVSYPRVERLTRRIDKESAPVGPPSSMTRITEQIRTAAEWLIGEVDDLLAGRRVGEEVRFDDTDAFSAAEPLSDRLAALKAPLSRATSVYEEEEIKDLTASIDSLISDIDSATIGQKNTARWMIREDTPSGSPVTKICASPVDVSSDLYFNLFTTEEETDGDSDTPSVADLIAALDDETLTSSERVEIREQIEDASRGAERHELNVVCVSATLSPSFGSEVGLHAKIREVPSPFSEAYAASAAYTPSPLPEDIAEIGIRRGKKVSLNTSAHIDWCAEQIAEMTYANSGSAMIISATARAAKHYAASLRADESIGFAVCDQWDPRGKARAIEEWKADESSVIVGTKSLMTGVDAPGGTNTLVIVDRPPRAPMNPVDKARADALIDEGTNKFVADARVYVEDASVLLHQAVGRLIRSNTDSGMVAVLDPRLVEGTAMSYPSLPRSIYTGALQPYGARFDHLDEALDWLEEARAQRG